MSTNNVENKGVAFARHFLTSDKKLTPWIQLPRYQREKVWKEDQKALLIDSVLRGFPFGSILLAITENESSVLLLDGHQRVSTIKIYLEDPLSNTFDPLWKHFTDEAKNEYAGIIKEQLNKRLDILQSSKICSKTMLSYLHNNFITLTYEVWREKSIKTSKLANPTAVASLLTKEIPTKSGEKLPAGFEDWLSDTLTECYDSLRLTNKNIPVITFSGNKSDHSDLFYRFNTKGTALTEFQTMAAKWSEIKVETSGKNSKALFQHAKAIVKENTDKDVNDMTLAEYFAGLSFLIYSRYPNLLNLKRGLTETKFTNYDFSWHILAYVTGHKLSDRTAILQEHLNSTYLSKSKKIDLEELTRVILQGAKTTSDALEFLKTGREKATPMRDYRYMAALTAAVTVALFPSIKFQQKVDTSAKSKGIAGIASTIAGRYIYDLFDTKTKQESRNSQLLPYIWNTQNEERSNWLQEKLSKVTFKKIAIDYGKELLNIDSTGRSRPSDVAKIVCQYLAINSTTPFAHSNIEHDHILPKNHRNVKSKAKPNKKLPFNIDHPGNFSPCDKMLNNAHGNKTIAEYWDTTSGHSHGKVKAFKKKFTKSALSEYMKINFKELKVLADKVGKQRFDDFVTKRYEKIIELICDDYFN